MRFDPALAVSALPPVGQQRSHIREKSGADTPLGRDGRPVTSPAVRHDPRPSPPSAAPNAKNSNRMIRRGSRSRTMLSQRHNLSRAEHPSTIIGDSPIR